MAPARRVQREPALEVVGRVHHDGRGGDLRVQVVVERPVQWRDFDLRIEREQCVPCGFDLAAADVGAVMDDLALEIGKLHGVVVAEHEVTDAGRREVHCDR